MVTSLIYDALCVAELERVPGRSKEPARYDQRLQGLLRHIHDLTTSQAPRGIAGRQKQHHTKYAATDGSFHMIDRASKGPWATLPAKRQVAHSI